jgi:hypothetical protein
VGEGVAPALSPDAPPRARAAALPRWSDTAAQVARVLTTVAS